jgi:hypothetical protein
METVRRFFRRWAELVRESKHGPPDNADGPCQHCREFVLSGDGIIAEKSLFCSDYCVQQDFAHRMG